MHGEIIYDLHWAVFPNVTRTFYIIRISMPNITYFSSVLVVCACFPSPEIDQWLYK